MMEVALHIPHDVAKRMCQVNGQNIARHILEEYAIRAYQEGTLGESHLRRLLGFETRNELEEFFAAHHVYRNCNYPGRLRAPMSSAFTACLGRG
jgi:hypothetical protein